MSSLRVYEDMVDTLLSLHRQPGADNRGLEPVETLARQPRKTNMESSEEPEPQF